MMYDMGSKKRVILRSNDLTCASLIKHRAALSLICVLAYPLLVSFDKPAAKISAHPSSVLSLI